MIPNNACTLRITAAAGTELAGAFWSGTVRFRGYCSSKVFFPDLQSFTTRRPSSLTRRRCVRLSPIAQYSPLLPPVGVWTVSQFQCAGHPLRPATRLSLGEPLPHQQADGAWAHPQAIASMERPPFTSLREQSVVSSGISTSFEMLSQTRGQVTHVLLTRAPLYSHPKVLSRSTCMC